LPDIMPRRFYLFAAVILVATGLTTWFYVSRAISAAVLARTARQALDRGEYERASELAQQLLERGESTRPALWIAGKAAASRKMFQEALALFDRVGEPGDEIFVRCRCAAGQIFLSELPNLAEAEQRFRQAAAADPSHVEANSALSYLLGIGGRQFEAQAFRRALLQQNSVSGSQLVLLALGESAEVNPRDVHRYHRANPSDPTPLLGEAVLAFRTNQAALAEEFARQAVAAAPEMGEAQAFLGRLSLASSRERFLAWSAAVSRAAESHPEIWVVRGEFASGQGEPRVAVRCFWEALRRNPDHQVANYRLSQILAALGEPRAAEMHRLRAQALQQLADIAKRFLLRSSISQASEAARKTESLGRHREAWGWYFLALSLEKQIPDADTTNFEQQIQRLQTLLGGHDRDAAPVAVEFQFSGSDYPLPSWSEAAPATAANRSETNRSELDFRDEAAQRGLVFQYFNNADPAQAGVRIVEQTGGGVVILDYDGDNWPDVYLTQGAVWPEAPQGAAPHTDRLFRNRGDGRFEDVTAQAGIFEDRYSQGGAAGDLNNDGYPDLYVANLGSNRLYLNNGDGTFSDITEPTQTGGNRWTTSCVIADLNGDTLPDLYAVNYLEGRLGQVCTLGPGKTRLCTPLDFAAAQDEMYLNLGEGRFKEMLGPAGLTAAQGKGLGVIAADLEGSGKLNLFIANDLTANHFFSNQAPRGARPHFVERGLQSGLAYDLDGQPQACMGIAAADSNGDQLLDLFVTNFYRESNTLYLQQPGGMFLDQTREAGLRDPSFEKLGFGTQFLDGELDGWPDLVVANGHVGKVSGGDAPYQMRPQYFRNLGAARFQEVLFPRTDSYFSREYVGRGLALLDWNRDGQEDFVVSHLDSPAALVTNHTPRVGRFLAIQLRGGASDRDAIGAKVSITSGNRTWTRQLTAGDGYQASNQRQLLFGLGDSETVDRVEVEWPSGLHQVFEIASLDTQLLLIEGRPVPIQLPAAREPP
jgi:tetratricopeptide (TPR) repeat protein